VAIRTTDIRLTLFAMGMGRHRVKQMFEQHGREGSRVFLIELSNDAFVGIMEIHQSIFPGSVHLFGLLSRPFMIVKAPDFFNGLMDDLHVGSDIGHLIFGITPLEELLEEARGTMLLPVLTTRVGAVGVLGGSVRCGGERERQADGNDSRRLHRSPVSSRSWVTPERCHSHKQYRRGSIPFTRVFRFHGIRYAAAHGIGPGCQGQVGLQALPDDTVQRGGLGLAATVGLGTRARRRPRSGRGSPDLVLRSGLCFHRWPVKSRGTW